MKVVLNRRFRGGFTVHFVPASLSPSVPFDMLSLEGLRALILDEDDLLWEQPGKRHAVTRVLKGIRTGRSPIIGIVSTAPLFVCLGPQCSFLTFYST